MSTQFLFLDFWAGFPKPICMHANSLLFQLILSIIKTHSEQLFQSNLPSFHLIFGSHQIIYWCAAACPLPAYYGATKCKILPIFQTGKCSSKGTGECWLFWKGSIAVAKRHRQSCSLTTCRQRAWMHGYSASQVRDYKFNHKNTKHSLQIERSQQPGMGLTHSCAMQKQLARAARQSICCLPQTVGCWMTECARTWSMGSIWLWTGKRKGKLIIHFYCFHSNRYSHSGIAYSLAKGLDRRWVCQPEVGLLRPDLILFFDAHPEKVAIRGGFGQEVMERRLNLLIVWINSSTFSDFQKAVYAKMEELFDQNYWRRIDAAHSVEEVHKVVVNAVTSLLESEDLENKPLEEFSPADFGLWHLHGHDTFTFPITIHIRITCLSNVFKLQLFIMMYCIVNKYNRNFSYIKFHLILVYRHESFFN